MSEILSRETYERHGWADGRLGQAFDLIEAVISDIHSETDGRIILKKIVRQLEDCDAEIEASGSSERRTA